MMKKTATISLSLLLAACASSDFESEVNSESYQEKYQNAEALTENQSVDESMEPAPAIDLTTDDESLDDANTISDSDGENQVTPAKAPQEVAAIASAEMSTAPTKGFAIQLATMSDAQKATAFAKTVQTDSALWLQEKTVNDTVVYSVLMGDFGDYDETKAAIAALPDAIKKLNPFLKNFSDKELAATERFKKL